jgi:hypothetical protein
VAVDDGRTARKRSDEPFFAARPRAGIVHHPDPHALDLDFAARGQRALQRLLVHVSGHGLQGAELAQFGQDAFGDDVARVEDQIGLRQDADALGRQPANAAGQMCVGNDRDDQRLLRRGFALRAGFGFTGAVMRNGLLTKTFVRAVFISAWSSVAST